MVNAVIMAGGKEKLGYKGRVGLFPEIVGERAINLVYRALSETEGVDHIIVVGDRNKLERILDSGAEIVHSDKTFYKNGKAGADHYGGGKILFVAKDLPLPRREHYQAFIDSCDFEEGDLFFSVVSRRHIQPFISEEYDRIIPYMPVLENHEGVPDEFRVGNMLLADIDNIKRAHILDVAYKLSTLRSKKNQFGAIFFALYYGIRYGLSSAKVAIDAKKGRLKYGDLEKAASRLFGTRFKVKDLDFPHSALDLDWEEEDLGNIEPLMKRELGI